MNHIKAIELVNNTWLAKQQKEFDWSKFTPLQLELITWLDKDDGTE